MQKYQCHKIVEAMKIEYIELHGDGSAALVGHDKELHYVTKEWMERHKPPRTGGYYVRYDDDDYYSWSPGQAFEDGYTLIPKMEVA